MASFNKVILVGNLTRDPELRYTTKGVAIGKIGMAVNRKWRTEAGEEKEEVTFVDVTAFGKQAEAIGQYVRKGHSFMMEGRLHLEQWDDKQTGQKKQKLSVILEGFQFLNNRQADGTTPAPQTAPSATGRSYRDPAPANDDMPPQDGDDVPF